MHSELKGELCLDISIQKPSALRPNAMKLDEISRQVRGTRERRGAKDQEDRAGTSG